MNNAVAGHHQRQPDEVCVCVCVCVRERESCEFLLLAFVYK